MNIAQILLDSAQTRPDHTVIVFKDRSFAYQELAEMVKSRAAGFSKDGIRNGTHVGLMMGNKPDYIVTYFALHSVGAVVIPINPTFKEGEITHILNDSEAAALVIDEIGIEAVKGAKPNLETVKTVYSLADDPDFIPLANVSGDQADYFIEAKENDDIAQIIYTSGTTGKPKGALITHGNLAWMTETGARVLELTEADRVLVVLPLFHAYAKLQGMLNSILVGATIFLEERFIPSVILEKIASEKITIFLGVPTMYTMFIQLPQINELDFSNLRVAGCGGASLPVEILEKVNAAMGVDIGEGYGQTESTVMISCFPQGTERVHGAVGYPLPGIEVKVVDPGGREVPRGEVGEIIFKGPNGMKGYYKREHETQETIKDGWVYTGDLGRQEDSGLLYIVDRKKDMIIRGGYNVYPREVEEVLYTHPDIIECAVVGEADATFGEEVAAYVVTRQERPADEIIGYCKEKMAHYKYPRKIYFMKELPKTTTGKILKTPLRNR